MSTGFSEDYGAVLRGIERDISELILSEIGTVRRPTLC